eukprot:9160404-Pyramimonas_sp.AAC.1
MGSGGEKVPTPYDMDLEELDEEGAEKLFMVARFEGPDIKRAFGELAKALGIRAKKQKCGWHYVSASSTQMLRDTSLLRRRPRSTPERGASQVQC